MKTSNKILIGIISIIGLSMLSVLIFAKTSLITVEDSSVGGNGKIIKATHNIAEISLFKLRGKFDVFVKKGEPSLIIETDENIQAFLNPHDENYYSNGKNEEPSRELRIGYMDHIDLKPTQGIKVYLSTPDLKRLNISDHSRVTFEDTFEADNFEVDINNFAEVDLKINTQHLNINAEDHTKLKVEGKIGDTNINAHNFAEVNLNAVDASLTSINAKDHCKVIVAGKTQTLNITAAQFADISAKNLSAKSAQIQSKDQTNALLNVSDKLDVNAAGFANIRYLGTPEITKKIGKQNVLIPIE